MAEDEAIEDFADVQDDLDANHAAADRNAWDRAAPFPQNSKMARGASERLYNENAAPGGSQNLPGAAGIGRRLLRQCAPDNRDRFHTLVALERIFPSTADHGILIAPVCQILESELERLVARPGRAVASHLVGALRDDGKAGPADLLSQWEAGKVPTTIGVLGLILLALRYGLAQQREPILNFLRVQFHPTYLPLLARKQIDGCLNVIRNRFRNPACHGSVRFDDSNYEAFLRLVLAQRRLAAWDAFGPSPPQPGGDEGILHHHVLHHRGDPCSPTSVLEHLFALRTPVESQMQIAVKVDHASLAGRQRDLTSNASSGTRPFRLGDRVRVEVKANAACHTVLIDVGTSGAISAIWPISMDPRMRIEAGCGMVRDFIVTGIPGTEFIKAIATTTPIAGLQRPPAPGAGRDLTTEEVTRLIDAIAGLPPATWAVADCEFAIEPGTT